MDIIQVENLSKYYKTFKRFPGLMGSFKTLFTREFDLTKGVDEISFSIKQGEAVGYLGPNGYEYIQEIQRNKTKSSYHTTWLYFTMCDFLFS